MAAPNIVSAKLLEQRGFSVITVTLSPAQVGANTTAEQDLTVSGLAVGDFVVSINKPTAQAGIGIVGARVKAADTLAVTFVNATGSAVTPTASEAYLIGVFRPVATKTAFEG
jgi:hypothetical protein